MAQLYDLYHYNYAKHIFNPQVWSDTVEPNLATRKPISLRQQPAEKYTYEGAALLNDGNLGRGAYNSGRWLGFCGYPLDAVIDLDPVHAPLSSELLLTIFYPGTRLHDGAVVVHGNEIVAASVFFTPSTQPFAGKYGSRHRAAIGVSEVSDAVTVVVSEETGRISIASNGELQMVDPMKFLMTFETYMGESK